MSSTPRHASPSPAQIPAPRPASRDTSAPGAGSRSSPPRLRMGVVIVNYKTPALVVDCLASLETQIDPALDAVIVIDNASPDGSLEQITRAIAARGWGSWARAQAAPANDGFAAGNNAGLAELDAGVCFLLNPDTIARPGALASLLALFEAHPRAGICGSALEDAGGRVEAAGRPLPSMLCELDDGMRWGVLRRLVRGPEPALDRAERCGWVSGAALAIRREVIDAVGAMDDGFFLYFEEVDLCRRASRAGWEIWHEPASRIVHLEGSSTGIADRTTRRARYWFESRRRYFVKHHGVVGLLLADALWSAGRLVLRARMLLRLGGSTRGTPLRFARDLLLGDLSAVVRGRAGARCSRPGA